MGAEYTLDDFRRQLDLLRQQERHALLDSGLLDFADKADELAAELELIERIIDAMTAQERHDPDRVGMSRRCELARATGAPLPQVCEFFTQFAQVRELMRRIGQKP